MKENKLGLKIGVKKSVKKTSKKVAKPKVEAKVEPKVDIKPLDKMFDKIKKITYGMTPDFTVFNYDKDLGLMKFKYCAIKFNSKNVMILGNNQLATKLRLDFVTLLVGNIEEDFEVWDFDTNYKGAFPKGCFNDHCCDYNPNYEYTVTELITVVLRQIILSKVRNADCEPKFPSQLCLRDIVSSEYIDYDTARYASLFNNSEIYLLVSGRKFTFVTKNVCGKFTEYPYLNKADDNKFYWDCDEIFSSLKWMVPLLLLKHLGLSYRRTNESWQKKYLGDTIENLKVGSPDWFWMNL